MKTSLIIAAISLMLVGGITFDAAAAGGSDPATRGGERGWTATTVAEGLDYPWDIVRDRDRFILTEKAGSIVMIEAGGLRRTALRTSAPLRTDGGAGLLGIALAPSFAATGEAFVYHSYEANGAPLNRVIKVRFDGQAWHEADVLIDAIPGHRLYNGGRIAIAPDGHLYVTTGWTEDYRLPQDLSSLAGKVLRVALDAAVPADNPFSGSLVYSYGHRNPQGLAWDPSGQLFVAEHGQSALDEINRVLAGANYGWPLISGSETRAGMEAPHVHSGRTTWAPSGIAFLNGTLLVSTLQMRGIYAVDQASRELSSIFGTGERYRHVLPVGDDLFVITTNRSPRASGPSRDRLLRLSRSP